MIKKYTTFVIDDDPIFVLLFKKIIAKTQKFENINNFHDAQLAINELINRLEKKQPLPDYIFLDLNMPNMDGWEFLEAIQKTELVNFLKIFIVSSSIDSNEIERAKNYSYVCDFICKPVPMNFFETTIFN